MEPEGSLPHSQVPATCPYPQPARPSAYPHIPLPEDPSNLRLGLPSGLFPSDLPTKTLYTPLLSHPYALHAPPISLFSVLSPEQYWVRSTDHYAPHYVVFSHSLSSRPSWAEIFSSTPYSQTPSVYVSHMLATLNLQTVKSLRRRTVR